MARASAQERDEDKEARRREIVSAARRLYASQPFAKITVAQIARAAGVAKGTVYLHFATKHELFVDVLMLEIDEYFAAIPDELTACHDGDFDADRLAAEIAAAIAKRHVLGRLLSILHIVLEQNLDEDAAERCKQALQLRLERAADAFTPVLPPLGRAEVVRFMLDLHAVIIGMHQASHPSPAVLKAVRRPALAALRLDFERELAHVVGLMLHGLTRHT